jgi:hypothetical protein
MPATSSLVTTMKEKGKENVCTALLFYIQEKYLYISSISSGFPVTALMLTFWTGL